MTGLGRAAWWSGKVRQFFGHLRARVRPGERTSLGGWLSPAQLELFDAMHVADQRHGLDVVRSLREQGVTDSDVLVAGLLHDAGKGDTGLWPRVAWSLGQAWGGWVWRVAGIAPGMRTALERLRDHADASAALAERAGCTVRTVDLIRHQEAPRDREFGELLRLADEAN
jgi:hypothetical protein